MWLSVEVNSLMNMRVVVVVDEWMGVSVEDAGA